MKTYRGYGYHTIFSPDDGGFYAEVSDKEGKDVEGSPTALTASHGAAEEHALDLIDTQPVAAPHPDMNLSVMSTIMGCDIFCSFVLSSTSTIL